MSEKIYNNGKTSMSNKKFFVLYITLIIIVISYSLFCYISYTSMVKQFKNTFDKRNFSKANSIVIEKCTLNPFKIFFLSKDLTEYFNSYMDDLIYEYNAGSLPDSLFISNLNEIGRYGLLEDRIASNKKNTPIIINSTKSYNEGMKAYNDKNYVAAINSFSKVNALDEKFLVAQEYKYKAIDDLKEQTLTSAANLVSQNYFTKAIELLQQTQQYCNNDKEISDKINEYKNLKNNFLAKISGTSQNKNISSVSAANVVINSSTINTLNLTSKTNYLLYVNLNNQKTYVYRGEKNQWSLVKTLTCSTGTKGSETPSGVFEVEAKGDWFYSTEYNEGGKNWIQFKDNYLFHSLPYDKDKTTILDKTLGKPASHGCIRLGLEDSKWLYSIITKGTKVIIN